MLVARCPSHRLLHMGLMVVPHVSIHEPVSTSPGTLISAACQVSLEELFIQNPLTSFL